MLPTREEIRSSDVIPPASVGDVHPETSAERMLRIAKDSVPIAAAGIIILGGLFILVDVLFYDHPALDRHRDEAWTVFVTLPASAAGFMFGRFSSDR